MNNKHKAIAVAMILPFILTSGSVGAGEEGVWNNSNKDSLSTRSYIEKEVSTEYSSIEKIDTNGLYIDTPDDVYKKLIEQADMFIGIEANTIECNDTKKIRVGAYADNVMALEEYDRNNSDIEIHRICQVYMYDSVIISYSIKDNVFNVISHIDRDSGRTDVGYLNTFKWDTFDYTIGENEINNIFKEISEEIIEAIQFNNSSLLSQIKLWDNITLELSSESKMSTVYYNFGYSNSDVKLLDRVFILLNYSDVLNEDMNERYVGVMLKLNSNSIVYDIDILR